MSRCDVSLWALVAEVPARSAPLTTPLEVESPGLTIAPAQPI